MTISNMKNLDVIIEKEYGNMGGISVSKDGKQIYEKYFNSCNADSHLHVYSVTKSIVSILLGIAIDQGFEIPLDQKVLDFFPDYDVPSRNRSIDIISLKNLLTMTAPFQYGLFPPYIKYFTSQNWVDFSLNLLGGRREVGRFQYTPLIGPDILSGILMKVTGKTVLELANEYLFRPLNITPKEQVIFTTKEEQMAFNKSTQINGWVADNVGINSAGWGLTLTANEMLKIGQLILNNGAYESQSIVSEEWVNNLLSVHSVWERHKLSYGLLWWIIDEDKKIYGAMGDGGNIIYVNKSKNLVVAINSQFTHRAKDRVKFIQKYIDV